ncbi:MAG: hypothetical protein ACJ74E_12330, partial [Actinomycetes bacterium]
VGEFAGLAESSTYGKICSHRGVNPDRNRILVLPCSTIMRSTSGFCRLIVISPTVSGRLLDIN